MRGKYYYLYLIEDIYSRKAVGWEVYEQENGERASELMERTVLAERCAGRHLGAALGQRRADEIGEVAEQTVRLGHHSLTGTTTGQQ